MKSVKICNASIGDSSPFTLVAGPCVIESRDVLCQAAEVLAELKQQFSIQVIFKSSYDKANRSSINSFRGPGIEEGLKLLEEVRDQFHLPIFTDVHSPEQATMAGEVCDVLQIPAFLCRQTDLLVAAGKTGKVVNVKKGQFLSANEMKSVVNKILSTNNDQITLTERGTLFGYQNLVVDFRNIDLMKELGFPILFDATHSVQLPGGLGSESGGDRRFIPTLSKAALASGVNGIYAETHPDPSGALCDAACQLPLQELRELIPIWIELFELNQKQNSPHALT
jgi:2-dehydro-3-deoxyphosphooctonate aldolase (KDO 8-P synthase)